MSALFQKPSHLSTSASFMASAAAKMELVTELFARHKETPAEVELVLAQARAIFENCPFPVWAKYEDGTNVYSNPHYRETILDYQGQHDVLAWGRETGASFLENDAEAAQRGGILVHENWHNPNTNRHEHGWIAKWPQVVKTATGDRTLVWGALLNTVVGRGTRSDSGDAA